jgi:hypothetical protein
MSTLTIVYQRATAYLLGLLIQPSSIPQAKSEQAAGAIAGLRRRRLSRVGDRVTFMASARTVRTVARSALCLTLLTLAAGSSAAAIPLQPLETAFVDPDVFTGPDADAGVGRAAAAGASAIKLPLFWNTIAPAARPSRFKPADPSDPAYDWTQLDAELRLVRAHKLEPIVYISSAPTWAFRRIDGFARPDPAQYAPFALAAVRRYSGELPGLPRVRYWEAWNEPNKVPDRSFKASQPIWYRTLVNTFAASVHSVPGNAVVAGGLAPFGISTAVAPLTFMRSLLCLSSAPSPRPMCSARVRFDIWSTDPYSAGGPTHRAYHPNDVSIAELPKMRAVLDAGVRFGHVVSPRPVRFWVTEFSWDSNPPDPGGVPAALEGRWVAEALYRMWGAGVSLVTWFTLRDQPVSTSPYQSGLYFRGSSFARDRPKPALTAFRFPFVAFSHSKAVVVWGHTPSGDPGTVVVEQHGPSGWSRVGVLRANRVGIFSGELRTRAKGPLRARLPAAATTSLPFSLVEPPDHAYQPFGAPVSKRVPKRLASAASQYVEVVPTSGGGSATGSASIPAAGETGAERRLIVLAGAMLAALLALGAAAVRHRRPATGQPRRDLRL